MTLDFIDLIVLLLLKLINSEILVVSVVRFVGLLYDECLLLETRYFLRNILKTDGALKLYNVRADCYLRYGGCLWGNPFIRSRSFLGSKTTH